MCGKLCDSSLGKIEHRREHLAGEGFGFGGALNLDDTAGPGHDEIRIRLGGAVLGVVEIEHRDAAADAA